MVKLTVPIVPKSSLNAPGPSHPKMVAKSKGKATGIAPSMDVDATLMNDLYESIENNPPGIEPRKVLVNFFLAAGWMDSAKGVIKDLAILIPYDTEVKQWVLDFCEPEVDEREDAYVQGMKEKEDHEKKLDYLDTMPSHSEALETSFADGKRELEEGAKEFKIRSERLLFLMQLRQKNPGSPDLRAEIQILRGLAGGKLGSTLKTLPNNQINRFANHTSGRPDSARTVAKKIRLKQQKAFDVIMDDFDLFVKWNQRLPGPKTSDEKLKALVLNRKQLIDNDIPEDLLVHSEMALMHLDREVFKKSYVNDETMYGDEISEIKRSNFLCTEDGYAWDMEELAAAIKANDGVMRNPLSKQMFTPSDIRSIISHKEGSGLKALQVEQSKLRKGIRPQTLDQMTKLSKAFLEDMEDDGIKSRHALDEFMAYMATLPDSEQKSLDSLSVPAKDSHTGMAFDGTIGQAVRDAKANKLCFHKAGDFIGQAANHLRKS